MFIQNLTYANRKLRYNFRLNTNKLMYAWQKNYVYWTKLQSPLLPYYLNFIFFYLSNVLILINGYKKQGGSVRIYTLRVKRFTTGRLMKESLTSIQLTRSNCNLFFSSLECGDFAQRPLQLPQKLYRFLIQSTQITMRFSKLMLYQFSTSLN